MVWQETPFTIALLIGAGVSVVSAVFTWKFVHVGGARWASFLLVICAEWLTTYTLELSSADLASKVLWNKLEYVGVVTVPTVLLLFTLRYTDSKKLLDRRFLSVLAIEPLATFSLVATNEQHRLIWSANEVDRSGSFAVLVNDHGFAFWINAAYSYALLLLVTALLVRLLLRSPQIYRWQASSLLFALMVPWVANVLFLTHLNPFPLLDLTSPAFTLASLIIAWAISGLRIGDIAAASRRAAIECMHDGVMVLDVENRIVYLNPAARRLIGPSDGRLAGVSVEGFWLEWSNPPEAATIETDHWDREVVLRREETKSTYDLRVSPVLDWRGRVVSRVVVIRDITERKRLEMELAQRYEEARYLAERDSVTGLLNHRAIHERLEQELKRAHRGGHCLSVVIMDVDDFKLFNDTYGHAIGDQVLRNVAQLLSQATRASDIFGRYGGDEFVVVLPETNTSGAILLVERLRSELAAHPYVAASGNRVPIRLSFGIAAYPTNGRQLHKLMGYADANLYESKQLGGDTFTIGGDEADTERTGTFGVLDGLVTAVDHKDRYTRKHSEDVTGYAIAIARSLGLSEESQRTLRIASLLHDIGKIGVPDRLLRKPGRLDEDEFAAVKQHVVLGEMIIKEVPNQADVLSAVGSHHERLDGSGYPRGLKGNEIPLFGRILAVADAYSAMTTDRVYRKAMSSREAREELLKVAGTQLDADIVSIFVRLLGDREQEEAYAMVNSSDRAPFGAVSDGTSCQHRLDIGQTNHRLAV